MPRYPEGVSGTPIVGIGAKDWALGCDHITSKMRAFPAMGPPDENVSSSTFDPDRRDDIITSRGGAVW